MGSNWTTVLMWLIITFGQQQSAVDASDKKVRVYFPALSDSKVNKFVSLLTTPGLSAERRSHSRANLSQFRLLEVLRDFRYERQISES